MAIYDLHSHTTHSDGTLSPLELVTRAKSCGVDVLALTDHDGTFGLQEGVDAARSVGIRFVPGVEISVTWGAQTVHIVGLGIDWLNEKLRAGLAEMQIKRVERAKQLGRKLETNGIPNALERVKAIAGLEAPTRTHFGRFLVDNGYARDLQDSFNKWLGKKGKAYVRGDWATLVEAVTWITAAGGQAVIAHPGRYQYTLTKLRCMIEEFIECGGAGLEVVSSSHSPQMVGDMSALAKHYALLASVGSDFHSPGNPRVELGRNLTLPANLTPIWSTW